MKKNIINILIIAFLFSCIAFVQPVHAHGVIYETKTLTGNKIGVSLKWSDPSEAQGIIISAYTPFINGKLLKIAYEIKEGAAKTAYMEFDLSSAISPIRIILTKVGDLNWSPFKDIKGIEGEENIRHLHDAGIINGVTKDEFKPSYNISREDFVTLIVKALKLEGVAKNTKGLTDIDKSYAKNSILLAVERGILSGYSDKTFRPKNPITIAEVSKILANAFVFKTQKDGIYDKLKQNQWYSSYVKKMFDMGILSTNDSIYNKNFKEESSISRVYSAIMISRALSTY